MGGGGGSGAWVCRVSAYSTARLEDFAMQRGGGEVQAVWHHSTSGAVDVCVGTLLTEARHALDHTRHGTSAAATWAQSLERRVRCVDGQVLHTGSRPRCRNTCCGNCGTKGRDGTWRRQCRGGTQLGTWFTGAGGGRAAAAVAWLVRGCGWPLVTCMCTAGTCSQSWRAGDQRAPKRCADSVTCWMCGRGGLRYAQRSHLRPAFPPAFTGGVVGHPLVPHPQTVRDTRGLHALLAGFLVVRSLQLPWMRSGGCLRQKHRRCAGG